MGCSQCWGGFFGAAAPESLHFPRELLVLLFVTPVHSLLISLGGLFCWWCPIEDGQIFLCTTGKVTPPDEHATGPCS